MPQPNKRLRTEEAHEGPEDEGVEETKECWDPTEDMVLEALPPVLPPHAVVRRRGPMNHLHKPSPHTMEYWQQRFPGFPDFVNEAFAAKAHGEEVYQEFLQSTEKPCIETTLQEEVEPGIIRDVRRTVNWF